MLPMQHQQPILYSFRRCPYAMRARLALFAAGMVLEMREINLRDKHPTFLETSPKGTVPVLVLDDDHIIDESLEIVDYVCQHHPQFKARNAETLADWLQALNTSFRPAINVIKYPERYPEANTDQAHDHAKQYCETLNSVLSHQAYLHGDSIGQADFIIFPFVRQLSRVNENIVTGYDVPMLTLWLDRITESPLFHRVMQKLPLWQ